MPNQIELHLSKGALRKMKKGEGFQMKHSQIQSGACAGLAHCSINLADPEYNRLLKSTSQGKGFRFKEYHGGSIMGNLKSGLKVGAKHLAHVGLKMAAKSGARAIASYAAGNDSYGDVASDAAGAMVDEAFKERPKRSRASKKAKPVEHYSEPVEHYSEAVYVPAPVQEYPSQPIVYARGLNPAFDVVQPILKKLRGRPPLLTRAIKGTGTPILDQQFSLNDVGRLGRKIFRGKGVVARSHMLPCKVEGTGTPILDQKFSLNDAGKFFGKTLPKAFGKGLKGSQEAKDRMAKLRAMRKTGGKIHIPKINWKGVGNTLLHGLEGVAPVVVGSLAGAAAGTASGNPVVGGVAGYAANQATKAAINRAVHGRGVVGQGARLVRGTPNVLATRGALNRVSRVGLNAREVGTGNGLLHGGSFKSL
jgi:hypothetical protein